MPRDVAGGEGSPGASASEALCAPFFGARVLSGRPGTCPGMAYAPFFGARFPLPSPSGFPRRPAPAIPGATPMGTRPIPLALLMLAAAVGRDDANEAAAPPARQSR